MYRLRDSLDIHSVGTPELQNNQSTVFAATSLEKYFFCFTWSRSQRHAGGLFSSAAISELMKDPEQLPTDITAEMYCLCPPVSIPDLH